VDAWGWLAVADGVLQGIDGECGGALGRQAPADDAAGEAVHDDGEVTPDAGDFEVADVDVPEAIGRAGIEVADAVGHAGEELEQGQRAGKQAIAVALWPGQSHQTGQSATAKGYAAKAKLARQARAAIEASGILVGLSDVLNQ
jgi:hypothetical protein